MKQRFHWKKRSTPASDNAASDARARKLHVDFRLTPTRCSNSTKEEIKSLWDKYVPRHEKICCFLQSENKGEDQLRDY